MFHRIILLISAIYAFLQLYFCEKKNKGLGLLGEQEFHIVHKKLKRKVETNLKHLK